MDTKLHEAVRYSDREGVLEALKENYDPNVLGLLRWSPVQEAARAGDREILFHLLEHGGDPNLPDGLCSHNTALHFAAAEGHLDCLRLLLKYGGDVSLLNAERKTCLQVAPLECKEAVSKLIMEFGGERRTKHNHAKGDVSDQQSSTETDKWDTLPKVPKQTEMGFLHLSFEYHKEMLKVRVWQISDLLLPPPQISMIHSIFVRAYFIPDKARKSHRRTEDIILDLPESSGGMESPRTGIQHIFTPSSFKFRTPLLYRSVTEAMVKERGLQLEVCMTQKRSHRTFLMAMVHMPLRTAVRRPIREKYPLIPCMNITIPNNMRVYSAAQLQLESSKGSNSPSIQRTVMTPPPAHEIPVTARDVELEDVVSLSGEDFLRSHLSLCLDEDSDNEGVDRRGDSGLREVTVSNGVGSGGSSTTTLTIPSSGEDLGNSSDEDVPTVVTDQQGHSVRSTPVDMSGVENSVTANTKKKIIPDELLKVPQHVTVEMPAEDTVVNIDHLPPPVTSHNTPASVSDAGKTRRKIKAAGLDSDIAPHTQSPRTTPVNQNTVLQDTVQSDTPPKQSISGSPITKASSRKKKIMVLPGEIDIPSGRRLRSKSFSPSSERRSAGSKGQSPRGPEFSPMQESAFSPASRPETPCWDFYDWSEDLQMEEGLEGSSRSLEDSLAELRQQGVHSLQNVSKEPILPMDLADDFDSLTVEAEHTTERL